MIPDPRTRAGRFALLLDDGTGRIHEHVAAIEAEAAAAERRRADALVKAARRLIGVVYTTPAAMSGAYAQATASLAEAVTAYAGEDDAA